jgi:diguanylate cyclase (GGDEF)-like protein/PAS domain S-box-containing protein
MGNVLEQVTPMLDTKPAGPAGPADAFLLTGAFEAVGAPIVICDDGGRVVHLNRAARRLFDAPHRPVLGVPFWDFTDSAEEAAAMAAEFARHVESRHATWTTERLWVDALGDRHRMVWTSAPVLDTDGRVRHVVAVGNDVTQQRRAEAALRQQAETDPLTGLPNRAAFEAALPTHLSREAGLGCALLFCDLDGFKAVNDQLGHAAGDAVLVEVGRRLNGTVREGDLVARLGGDEFVVLLPGLGGLQVRALASRVERVVARPLRLSEGVARVGVSVGVRVADAGDDPATVLAEADAAMYAVKARRPARAALPRSA